MMRRVIALLALACAFWLADCGGGLYVWVKQDRFTPEMPEGLRMYKGASVYLASFSNEASDTSFFYYYSPDRSVTYEGAPTLHSYLWYCFQKAFRSLGMAVYEHDAPPNAPELKLVVRSWTDRRFEFDVVLTRAGVQVHEASFAVTAVPPRTENTDQLEKSAYEMVNSAIVEILEDREFQVAFFGGGGL